MSTASVTERKSAPPIWEETLFWLKRGRVTAHAKIAATAATSIVFILVAPVVLDETELTVALVSGIAIVGSLLIRSQRACRRIQQRFGVAEPRVYRHIATPISSLLNALAHENISLTDIKEIDFETETHGELINYLNSDGKELVTLFKKNPGCRVNVYGFDDLAGDKQAKRETICATGEGRLKFFNTGRRTYSHRNIIKTNDDRFYLWYEDHHEIVGGHHFYPSGAALFKLDRASSERIEDGVRNGREQP